MLYLNKKQLAFILDITTEEARAKMCVAYSKDRGETNKAEYVTKKNKFGDKSGKPKLSDPYPDAMLISMLAIQLNLPTLQDMVNDIETGYLTRPAAKKWILCDFPEKKEKAAQQSGEKFTLQIPPGLKSMLPTEIQQQIQKEWTERFPKAKIKA